MFEFIIMRKVKDERWAFHRRLPSTVTEEQVRAIAVDTAKRHGQRVTVLGADQLAVQTLFYCNQDGEWL